MRTALTAILVALLAMLFNPAPAAAHAFLLSTTPDNWQLLNDSPAGVSMRFSEPVDLGLAQLRLIGPRGNDIAGIGRPEHAAGNANDTLAIRIPETLPNGTYTVAWRVISADTHPVQGAFTFSVREATAPAAVAMAGDPGGSGLATVAYGVARWLAFAGFALFVGTAFMIAAGWPGTVRRRGARRMLTTGLITMLAATLGALLLYGPYVGGLSLAETMASRIGRILVVRVVLLGLAAAFLIRFLRRDRTEADLSTRDRARRSGLVLAGAVVLAVTWSLVTHSAGSGLAALSVPIDVVHLVAAAVWVGGLPVLLGVLLRSGDVLAMRAAIPRFSTLAGGCVAVLVATGLYQSWRQVGTVSALLDTTYGGWLLAKLALLAVLLSIGALARRWVHRQYGVDVVTATDKRRAKRGPELIELGRFRRLVAAEVLLGGLLLGVTASLTATEPARAEQDRLDNPPRVTAAAGPVSRAIPFDAGGQNGKGQLVLVFAPAKVGPNELHVAVLDPGGGTKKVPELRAELRLPAASIGPIPVPLRAEGADRFSSPDHYLSPQVNLPMAGQWELALTVRTSEVDQTTVRIPVNAG